MFVCIDSLSQLSRRDLLYVKCLCVVRLSQPCSRYLGYPLFLWGIFFTGFRSAYFLKVHVPSLLIIHLACWNELFSELTETEILHEVDVYELISGGA